MLDVYKRQIYNELRVRGYNVDVGIVEVFQKNNEGKLNQERNSLANINDSFNKIIVVKDNIKPGRDENGIMAKVPA